MNSFGRLFFGRLPARTQWFVLQLELAVVVSVVLGGFLIWGMPGLWKLTALVVLPYCLWTGMSLLCIYTEGSDSMMGRKLRVHYMRTLWLLASVVLVLASLASIVFLSGWPLLLVAVASLVGAYLSYVQFRHKHADLQKVKSRMPQDR